MGNDNSQIKRKTCEDVLMTFHCHRLSCKMSEQACVHNQQIAREAQRGRPGGYPDHYYDRALSCFDCEQGKEIAGQKPEPKSKLKIVKKRNTPKRKPKPPKRQPIPLSESPLCSQCGRWVVFARGLCQSCYQREYRGNKRTGCGIE